MHTSHIGAMSSKATLTDGFFMDPRTSVINCIKGLSLHSRDFGLKPAVNLQKVEQTAQKKALGELITSGVPFLILNVIATSRCLGALVY